MSTRDNLDDLLRDKLGGSQQIDYNPAAWSKMEAMLDAQMPVASAAGASSQVGAAATSAAIWTKKWFIAASIFTLLGTSMATYLWLNDGNNQAITESSATQNSTEAAPKTVENTADLATENNSTASSLSEATLSQEDENSSFSSSSTTETTHNSTIENNSTSTFTKENSSLSQSQTATNISAAQQAEATSNALENAELSAQESSLAFASQEAMEGETVSPTGQNADVESSIALANSEAMENVTTSQGAQESLNTTASDNQNEDFTSITRTEIDKVIVTSKDNAFEPLALVNDESIQGTVELPEINRSSLFVVGGLNLAQSMNATNSSSFSGNEFFGIGYERSVSGRFTLGANLIYQPRTEVGFTREFETVYYNFGKHTESTCISVNKLYYIELPIYASYHIGSRHTVLAGVSTNYLIQAKNEVAKETITPFDETTSSDEEYGYLSGMERWDFALTAGYEFLLTERLTVGTRASYGLKDVSKNNYYRNNSFDRNLMMRAVIKYNLFQ